MQYALPILTCKEAAECEREFFAAGFFGEAEAIERAGSGIPNIFRVWRERSWAAPEITEQLEPERTVLTLLFSKRGDKKATIKSDDKKVTIKSAQQKEEIIAYLTDHVSAKSSDIFSWLWCGTSRHDTLA